MLVEPAHRQFEHGFEAFILVVDYVKSMRRVLLFNLQV